MASFSERTHENVMTFSFCAPTICSWVDRQALAGDLEVH